MRWLVLTDDWGMPGGVATLAESIATALAVNHQVTVLCRQRNVRDLAGVEVVGVPGPSFGRWGGLWTGLRSVPELPQTDRILAMTWPVATRAAWMARRLRIPLQVILHGSDWTAGGGRRRDRVLRRAHKVWAVSRFLADQAGAEVLPLPIDPVEAVPTERSGWAFAGRCTPLKGGDRFVRLVAAARQTGVVLGDGPARPAWEALARLLKADVRFEGAVDRSRVLEVLGRAELAFLLSRPGPDGVGTEGLGLVGLEAMSRGTPVVGCRTGGIPEASGLILDDPDDVAGSVEQIRAWRPRDPHPWLASRHGAARTLGALGSDGEAG